MNPLKIAYKALRALLIPKYRFAALAGRGYYDAMPDGEYLKRMYRYKMNKELNLKNPRTLTEKLNWLKIYDRNPEYTIMVDKYAVKKFITDKLGPQYVIPLLGVYNSFDEINFDALPEQFVLKCTHDSGGFAICRDKSTFDKKAARRTLNASLRRTYGKVGREWVYKDVPKRIIAEKFIDSLGKSDSLEYKLTCFNGKVKFFTICRGIAHSSFNVRTNDHYDRDFKRLNFWVNYKNPKTPEQIPEQMSELIALSDKLAEGIPQVRIDWYIIDGKIYFGEMTFFTWGGFMRFNPPEYDEILGSWLKLPEKNN